MAGAGCRVAEKTLWGGSGAGWRFTTHGRTVGTAIHGLGAVCARRMIGRTGVSTNGFYPAKLWPAFLRRCHRLRKCQQWRRDEQSAHQFQHPHRNCPAFATITTRRQRSGCARRLPFRAEPGNNVAPSTRTDPLMRADATILHEQITASVALLRRHL